MGKQEVLDTLTDEWMTSKDIEKILNQRVSTLLRKLREHEEVIFRYIKKGNHWTYEYKKK